LFLCSFADIFWQIRQYHFFFIQSLYRRSARFSRALRGFAQNYLRSHQITISYMAMYDWFKHLWLRRWIKARGMETLNSNTYLIISTSSTMHRYYFIQSYDVLTRFFLLMNHDRARLRNYWLLLRLRITGKI